MTGRKQFDEEAALEAAMRLFWTKGYQAASMAEIEAATGLSKSSIYNAWGGKEALYALCLKRFSRRFGEDLHARLDAPIFAEAVAGFFDALIARFEDRTCPDGCFSTMAAMELGGDGSPGAQSAAATMIGLQNRLTARCRKAAAEGEIDVETDCEALAALILAQTRGVAVLNRGAGDAALARKAVRGLLTAILPQGTAPAPAAAQPALSYPDP